MKYRMRYTIVMMLCVSQCQSGVDTIVYGTMKKGLLCMTAAFCSAKLCAHGVMAQFYFKESLKPKISEKNKYEVVQPPEKWREWATASWGKSVEKPSYVWHSSQAFIWLSLGLGCLYGAYKI